MEHLVLFGPQNAQQKWQRLGVAGAGELLCFFPERPPKLSDEMKLPDAIGTAKGQLQESPGIVVVIDISAAAIRATIHRSGKGAGLPTRVLLVGLDGRYTWKEIAEKETAIELSAWQSLVIPVAAGLEKKLDAFIASLDDLPADYRAAMLFNLVVPTLEARIARLEQIEPIVRSFPAGGSSSHRRNDARVWGYIRDVVLLGSMVTLLFGLGSLYSSLSDVRASLEEQKQAPERATPAPRPNSDGANGRGLSSSSLPPPATATAPAAGSFEDKLNRFMAGRTKMSEPLVLDAITFQGPTPTFTAAGEEQLQAVVDVLKKNPDLDVEISGHADSQGSPDQRQRLSDERAAAIAIRLVDEGVESNRLTSRGLSDSRPLANEPIQSTEKNRRVELRLTR